MSSYLNKRRSFTQIRAIGMFNNAVVKTIRTAVEEAAPVPENLLLYAKIVHVVRNPRGMLRSWYKHKTIKITKISWQTSNMKEKLKGSIRINTYY